MRFELLVKVLVAVRLRVSDRGLIGSRVLKVLGRMCRVLGRQRDFSTRIDVPLYATTSSPNSPLPSPTPAGLEKHPDC